MKDIFNKIVLNTYRLIFGEEPTSSVNNFAKNLSFVAVGFGVSAILSLITQIIAGRILGPLEYGKYALIQAAAAFLSLPMLVGVTTALTKYSAEKDNFDERKKIISTSYILFVFFSIVSLIILSIFSKIISGIFGMSLELFIYAIVFSFLFSSYTISISIAQGLKEMKILSLLQIIYGISGIVAFFIFIFFKMFSFKAILFASSINYLVVFVLSIVIFRKYFSFNFDKILAQKILGYGFYAFAGYIAYIIYSNFDKIVINRFLGAGQVGIYGSYYLAFITSAAFIFNVFNFIFFPMVSGTKDKEAVIKKINKIIVRLSLFALFFVLFMGIVVIKLYGSKYQFNFWLCLSFTIASIFSILNLIYTWCMNAVGKKGAKITSIAAITAAIINIAVNIIFVPVLGFFGAVTAIILSSFVSIVIIMSKKEYYKLAAD